MSNDNFVYFKNKIPVKEDLIKILEDYLSNSGTVEVQKDRCIAKLVGSSSFPFKRIWVPSPKPTHEERWFEVFFDLSDETSPNVDVLTRQADEYTQVIAEGYAAIISRYYTGRKI